MENITKDKLTPVNSIKTSSPYVKPYKKIVKHQIQQKPKGSKKRKHALKPT